MSIKKWKQRKDPLLRGDSKTGVQVPTPNADDSIVRHILYLEGPGRETPYLSASDNTEAAEFFAKGGAIWSTFVKKANNHGVRHISNSELLSNMKGNGKGKAKWDDAFEVMTARRYAEQWSEHLLDFRDISDPDNVVTSIFDKT
ncbi:hypothetical protein RP726_20940 (plasmid) [Candidatus Methylospira mobilis]|uniref:hypothetical protein n=1 Tax=Candidatus Methylospira mobilis TaxID=1808979 RepID=UPI0028EE4859|nr:hypothetical protein [Candidatus Methylospira mobilis]WNV06942.1 hypothetical protein RP726_20940 [Candidatus Methylospira mobilis]